MLIKKKLTFKEIGYLTKIPNGADIDDYEKIDIKDKNGKVNTLYRTKNRPKMFDETTNFNRSWKIFINHLH